MKRPTVILAFALGAFLLTGTYVAPAPSAVAKEEYTLEQWDKNFEGRIKKSVTYYSKLADWCDKNGLQWTSTRMRRYIFTLLPDDPDTRGFFGYEKRDGKWVQSDLRRDEFRSNYIDDKDPNGMKFRKAWATVVKNVSKQFASAAKKADKQAADPELAHEAAEWKARAVKAWEYVLALRPDKGEDKALHKYAIKDQDAGHESLGHPKFEGEYVTPYQLRFLEVRAERARRSKEIAASDPKVEEVAVEGPMASAGLNGGGGKGENIAIYAVHGKDVAVRAVKAGEKAIVDAIDMYAFPEALKERLRLRTLNLLEQGEASKDQFRSIMKAAGMNEDEVERLVKNNFGGAYFPGGGGHASTVSKGKDVEDSAINLMNKTCAETAADIAAQSVGRKFSGPEDWLWQSMGYDASQRLNETTLLVWGAFGKYGQQVRTRPGQNLWITLARQQVELDDDVSITQLYVKDLGRQEFRGREIVKGYAFLQFLFENDTAKAREFIWNALPNGTPHAAMVVYGPEVLGDDNVPEIPPELPHSQNRSPLPEQFAQVMTHLDEAYKDWILKSY